MQSHHDKSPGKTDADGAEQKAVARSLHQDHQDSGQMQDSGRAIKHAFRPMASAVKRLPSPCPALGCMPCCW